MTFQYNALCIVSTTRLNALILCIVIVGKYLLCICGTLCMYVTAPR